MIGVQKFGCLFKARIAWGECEELSEMTEVFCILVVMVDAKVYTLVESWKEFTSGPVIKEPVLPLQGSTCCTDLAMKQEKKRNSLTCLLDICVITQSDSTSLKES